MLPSTSSRLHWHVTGFGAVAQRRAAFSSENADESASLSGSMTYSRYTAVCERESRRSSSQIHSHGVFYGAAEPRGDSATGAGSQSSACEQSLRIQRAYGSH